MRRALALYVRAWATQEHWPRATNVKEAIQCGSAAAVGRRPLVQCTNDYHTATANSERPYWCQVRTHSCRTFVLCNVKVVICCESGCELNARGFGANVKPLPYTYLCMRHGPPLLSPRLPFSAYLKVAWLLYTIIPHAPRELYSCFRHTLATSCGTAVEPLVFQFCHKGSSSMRSSVSA